jgi:hypothetical protein
MKPEIGLHSRIILAIATACLLLLVLYPWNERSFSTEGNWVRGPLELFKVQAFSDQLIGGIVATALVPLIVAFIIKPNRTTAGISIAGTLAWVGFGFWLASMAAC